jgi:hypothetical protein
MLTGMVLRGPVMADVSSESPEMHLLILVDWEVKWMSLLVQRPTGELIHRL